MSKYHLLIDKFINRTISSDERKTLEKWILESEANLNFFRNRIKESNRKISVDFDADLAYKRFSENLKSRNKTPKLFHAVLKYAAMFAILFAIGFLAKRQLLPTSSEISIDAVKNEQKKPTGNDIIIKLADGTAKVLSSEGNEKVTDANGKIVASKGGNTLVFDEAKELSRITPAYNEVFIPFGQTFKLKLSDGTMVWLNAGSKLRFPQNFLNSVKNRIVYLEGEAFFDVAKNKNKPFIVNTQEVDVKVLGTKFNISSYETDDYIATTLVEGSVSVYETRTPENDIQLTPSFQAKYDKFGNHFNKAKVDTNIYTAWMQNRLVIDNLKFSELLVKLERRYFVKFVNKAESLNDEIYKGEFVNEDIETILKTISLSTAFEYEINQNVITITK
ncbi:FecR family protein [Ulvibacterium marinum]|uniref:FecR family protein n=1 Tax=Ulvibacterium marinum TaxID=2419782 RepID=A0A3B0CEE3_9FLAO|nr:FecR family protein [Ulvibacterium marinum]RKN83451.1 FecR family protein [Ulvibacterium marinum]